MKQEDNSVTLIEQVKKEAQSLHSQVVELKRQLQSWTYPFDHAQGPLSVGDFVIKVIPSQDELGSLYDAASNVLEQFGSLGSSLLGRLAQIAEDVEAALGLPPLEPPVEKPTSEAAASDGA